MHYWVERFKPTSIHVFWDCKTKDGWRKTFYPEYKDHRGAVYERYNDIDVCKCLMQIEDNAKELLEYSNIRQYKVDTQEADDLIYAACVVLGTDIVIISGDEDLLQINRAMPYVNVFDPIKKQFMEKPDINLAVAKALMGDKSDNIQGYRGIGKVKSRKLAGDRAQLMEFLKANGASVFKRNLALIDLSRNPDLEANKKYLTEAMTIPTKFDKSKIVEIIGRNRIGGLLSEYHDLVTPLRSLTY